MDVTWLGHACFRLRGASATILTDPFPVSMGGTVIDVESEPDIVTVSNDQPNHSHLRALESGFRLMDGPGEYGVSGVYVRGFMTPAAPKPDELPPPRNTAYLFEFEDLRVCHLGDLSALLPSAMVDELSPMDVLFLPVGEGSRLELEQSISLIRQLEARIVIPMHFRDQDATAESGGLDPFLREMGLRDVEVQTRLSVTATNLPAETRIVPMRPMALPNS